MRAAMLRSMVAAGALALAVSDAGAACGGVVKFRPGEAQASYSGAVAGFDVCAWRFEARAGQKVTVWLAGSSDLQAILYTGDGREFENGLPLTLARGGAHELRVLQPRSAARRGDRPKPFTLRIAITDR